MSSAYLTLALVVVQFLIDPNRLPNALDEAFRKTVVSSILRVKRFNLLDRWTKTVESAILAISDMQLITSLAILISGYIQLLNGVSLYHWNTIVDLAWFSALTHLTTLTSLRQFFRKRPPLATCRVLVMGLVLILLSVAFVPTGYAWQKDYWKEDQTMEGPFIDPSNPYRYLMSVPTICLYSSSSRAALKAGMSFMGPDYTPDVSPNGPLVGLSLAYLLTSYMTRVIRIAAPLAQTFERWLRTVPIDFLQKRYQLSKARRRSPICRPFILFHRALLLLVITLAEAFYEVGDSMLWEILWLSMALAWGTLRLIGLRAQTPIADENRWGFGQVLPLMLLTVPIWCQITALCISSPGPVRAIANQSNAQNTRCLLIVREIKETAWFRVVTILIVGMALVLAADLLFDLPGNAVSNWGRGIQSISSGPFFGWYLISIIFVLAFCLSLLTALVLLGLVLHLRQSRRQPTSSLMGQCIGSLRSVRRQRLHFVLWCLLIFSLLVLEAGFIVLLMFFAPF